MRPGFHTEDWLAFAAATVFWCVLYMASLYLPIPLKGKYRTMPLQDELDLRNRLISFIHGLSVLCFTSYELLFLSGSCMAPNTVFENFVMLSSMGYFTYDFIAMAYYGDICSSVV